jgi:hypothetical protein
LLIGSEFIGSRHASLNGLLLPANLAVQQARRCCVALHVKTNFDAWPVGNCGSGVLYRFSGRRFCIFTRHQLRSANVHPAMVMLRLTESERRFFSGGRYIEFPDVDDRQEEHDLCALELPWSFDKPGASSLFFDAANQAPLNTDGSELCFAIGYPSKLTKMLGEDTSEGIALSQVLVWATSIKLAANDLPMLELMPGVVMGPLCSGDFDGFSGGPVFSLNSNTQRIELRGITIRGGIDKLFFVPTDCVQKLCEVAMSYPRISAVAA